MKSLKLSLLLGIALSIVNLSAIAGPGPQQVYRPINSKQELTVLKPGAQIAHECPHCGTIAISKVGKDQSHAVGFTCPVCKMTISYLETGGGKGPKLPVINCLDSKTGKKMTARVCVLQS